MEVDSKLSLLDLSLCVEYSLDISKMFKMELVNKKKILSQISYSSEQNLESLFENWKSETLIQTRKSK